MSNTNPAAVAPPAPPSLYPPLRLAGRDLSDTERADLARFIAAVMKEMRQRYD